MKLSFFSYNLYTKFLLRNSYKELKIKKTFFIKWKFENKFFLSECPYFNGLTVQSENAIIKKLTWMCNNFSFNQKEMLHELKFYSNILFAYEQILQLMSTKTSYIYIPSKFTENKESININGLIWMGSIKFIKNQIQNKINQGFKCLKLKIGKSWSKEIYILKSLRKLFNKKQLEIRLDANGAYSFEECKKKINSLLSLDIHSIEQPIKIKNWNHMRELSEISLIPIALDEELIGINDFNLKKELLEYIKPHFLVLKPSLIGGIHGTLEWIKLCKKYNISWWITSALESNIGLNFIAQWSYMINPKLTQGFDTINLFLNNFYTPLCIKKNKLFFSFNHVVNH